MVFLRSLWLLWCDESFPQVGIWILSTCLRSYHSLACPFLDFRSPCSQIVFSQADAGQKPWAIPCDQLMPSFLTVPALHECQHWPPKSSLCPLCSVRTQALPLLHSQGHNLEATTCRDNYGVLPSHFPSIRDHRPALLTYNEKKLLCYRLYYIIIHCLWTEGKAWQYGFDVVPGLIKCLLMHMHVCVLTCSCQYTHGNECIYVQVLVKATGEVSFLCSYLLCFWTLLNGPELAK